ncbi:TPA: hypothetical protein N0F65_007227 [Lagenidium giganteum]|uniref:Uncharacterized protein n=1 Tax=Lagenidium giganteum TaxID=4803 RepID=A0AAV2Z613_9STRA|nr:TPA: hypothetical protein N0F65_007227 [Lagenidium giganteum]
METPNDAGHAYISHKAEWRIFGLCWATRANDHRLAATSYIVGEYVNKLQVLKPSTDGKELVSACTADHPYPATKVMWAPDSHSSPTELLATTADYLRLWNITDSGIERKETIFSERHKNQCAPLTSFDWNSADPNIIGTSSIDTTCTIWDLNSPQAPKQQIIAHDDEVYDIAFSTDPFAFGSVGGDGSLRLFDLRRLESSTIVYESKELKPLVRLAWNKLDNRYIAAMVAGSPKVVVLDLRNATRPVFELSRHTAMVNSIAWSPHSRFHLCSAAEDKTAIVYDISGSTDQAMSPQSATTTVDYQSSLLFRSQSPITHIRWSNSEPNYVALCEDSFVHVVQI